MDDIDEIVAEFLVESRENLDQIERDLVALENEPGEASYIASIFRSIHTIKGTCGFLGFGQLEAISHTGETLLSLLRDGRGMLTGEIASVLLTYVDAAREQLVAIEQTGSDGGDHEGLISALERCIAICEAAPNVEEGSGCETPGAIVEPPSRVAAVDPVTPAVAPEPPPVAPAASAAPQLPEPGIKVAPEEPPPLAPSVAQAAPEARLAQPAESSVRVQVQLLDRLMNLVGELVLARNAIVRFSDPSQDAVMASNVQRLNQLTTELQEGVMATRMQPIDNVWNKFPRVVRDLALQCGKRIRLEMVGKDTGLDKTLIEAIKDPMTHLIRNCVDHGIESPEVRQAAGKAEEGRITLQAYHEGGQVNIEINDDGGGISVAKVLRKAKAKGLVSEEEAQRLSPRQITQMIFLPGFSTAEQVSSVSGRGVGMDVVKTNVERLGGSIEVDSQEGRGTTFRLKIPLTLAIVPALIVSVAEERYAVPQTNLLEIVRLDEQYRASIEDVLGSQVFQLRGRMVPLIDLGALLGVSEPGASAALEGHIIVLESDGQHFGVVVEDVCDSEEIVVKSLSKHIKGLGIYAGATILGDGDVALIIDVAGLARRAGIIGQHATAPATTRPLSVIPGVEISEQSQLVVELSGEFRAIPMDSVLRLEEVNPRDVEVVGGYEVIQYRGDIMPLCRIGSAVAADGEGALRLVVFDAGGVPHGLVVDRVVDIARPDTALSLVGRRQGVRGTCVIRGQVTEVFEVTELSTMARSAEGRVA